MQTQGSCPKSERHQTLILSDHVKAWSAGDVFYVVEEGSFTIFDDDENELARVGKGSCFGELALLRQVGY